MVLSADEVRDCLRGVTVGLLSPFDEQFEISHDQLAENARRLTASGLDNFMAPANISEYHSLTHDERVAFAETAVEALPDHACVLAAVGGSTKEAARLIEAYESVGVDVMMIMPPDHTYINERGLLTYYQKLSDVTERPFVPYVRGFSPSIQYLADLTRLDRVVGIKYAIEEPVKLGAAVRAGADDVVWVDGLAESFAISFWAEGVEGFSAGVSNFRPEVGLELYDALSVGDWERARQLRDICLPFQDFRGRTGANSDLPGGISVPVVKKGLELAGLNGGDVREPIRSLSPEDERTAVELYQQLDDDIERLI